MFANQFTRQQRRAKNRAQAKVLNRGIRANEAARRAAERAELAKPQKYMEIKPVFTATGKEVFQTFSNRMRQYWHESGRPTELKKLRAIAKKFSNAKVANV